MKVYLHLVLQMRWLIIFSFSFSTSYQFRRISTDNRVWREILGEYRTHGNDRAVCYRTSWCHVNIPANPYIIADSRNFLFNHSLHTHRARNIGCIVIHIKDEAIGPHHHIVANNSSIGDMRIDSDPRIVAYFYIQSRCKPSFPLYIHMLATFLKYMLT